MDFPETNSRTQTERKAVSYDFLVCFEAEGETFLSRIVTADETCINHFEPKTKNKSMEWHHPQSTRGEKKFKSSPSASNVINAVF
jgi:hypothetical protein